MWSEGVFGGVLGVVRGCGSCGAGSVLMVLEGWSMGCLKVEEERRPMMFFWPVKKQKEEVVGRSDGVLIWGELERRRGGDGGLNYGGEIFEV